MLAVLVLVETCTAAIDGHAGLWLLVWLVVVRVGVAVVVVVSIAELGHAGLLVGGRAVVVGWVAGLHAAQTSEREALGMQV